MENPLASILKRVLKAESTVEAASRMREAELLVIQDFKTFVTEQTIRLMGKLARRPDFQVTTQLTRLYLIISKNTASLKIELTTLVNDIFLLAERLKGTESGELLGYCGQELLVNLIKDGGLNAEQQQIAQQLLDKRSNIDFEKDSQDIIQALNEGDVSAMLRLFDLMSQCSSLKEQFEVFGTQLSQLVSTIEPLQHHHEMQYHTFRFLEHFIFQNYYYIKAGTNAQVYSVMETRFLTEDCFFTAMIFVKMLMSAEQPIKASLLRVLKRLWFTFPKRRPNLKEALIEVLRAAAAGEPEQCKSAAKFYYYLRNDPETEHDLKSVLDHDPNTQALEAFGEYSRAALINPEVESTESLDQLQVFAGFALSMHIPAGESSSYVIEAPEANCILTWGFATKAHDLSYSLSRVDLAIPQIIIDQHRIECSHEPVVGAVLLQSPGIYKIVWDNTYSWFREKYVRFRISVLKPERDSSTDKSVLKGPIGLQGEEDDYFVNPQGEVLEIGVEIKNNHVSLRSQNESEDLEVESAEVLPLVVAGFIEKISDPNMLYHRKIGIVESEFRSHPELDELGSVAFARDAEAVAWLCYNTMHTTTLISVIVDNPMRSAVIHRGRLLADDNGNSLGDLSRLPPTDPVSGVTSLIMMFGPAIVVVTGMKGQFIEFSERVKEHIPLGIWQQTVLRESIHGDKVTLEAAYKLQYLRHQYKHTF
mmetsp:Transcript_7867/g.15200  ORF Transcript_7867/g.15200 Transcript_7867/m.15200 type:complete len:704 (-) Transcript_7867:1631-3742(-)